MVDPRVFECTAPGNVPGQGNTYERLSKLKATSPQRDIAVTCKSPVGDISAVTLIRTDIALDHNQKAEKVCSAAVGRPFKQGSNTASILGLGVVNAQTAPLALKSFRSRSLANQAHDHRDWG